MILKTLILFILLHYQLIVHYIQKKKFIFGPHFSVFPDNRLFIINNQYNNAIYIQPSDWAAKTWINMKANTILPIKPFAFPVDTERFKPSIHNYIKHQVFIYFKARDPN